MREKLNNVGKYSGINEFVNAKIIKFNSLEISFKTMFELMFEERNNILYEESRSYRIIKTTYGQAYDEILGRAFALKEMTGELEYNSMVGLFMDNSLDWIETFWAILICGFRPVLMNLRLPNETLEQIIKKQNIRLVITDSRSFSCRTVRSEKIVKSDTPVRINDVVFGTEVFVMSSGTSHNVKLCAYTAESFYYQINDSYNIIKECAQMKKHYEGELKQLNFLPFYHIFGLVAVYIWFTFFSRTMVRLNDMSARTILTTIKRHKVTHIFAVPLFWNKVYEQAIRTIKGRGEKTYGKFLKGMQILKKVEGCPPIYRMISKLAFKEVRDNLFGDSICFMIAGGSYISEEVLSFFNAVGYHMADGYGMSEIGITSVELSRKPKLLNSCMVGEPLKSVEYMINDDKELLVRGKSLASYVIEGDRIHKMEGWFNTHDLAECIDGHYRILGRGDDLVISPSGENINPNIIEPLINFEDTRGACLIGPSIDGNVCPVLLVSVDKYICSSKACELEKRIADRLREVKLSGMVSKICLIREPLMKGEEFKLNRIRLTTDYLEGNLKTIDSKTDEPVLIDLDEISSFVRSIVSTEVSVEIEKIAPDSDIFTELGASSLEYYNILTGLKTEYDFDYPLSMEESLRTVKAFSEFIKEHIGCND